MLGTSILVSLATVLVSIINFLSQTVLAWKFGATHAMDIYLLSISVPMFVSGILSVGLSYSLVPTLIHHQSTPDKSRRFAGQLFVSFFLIATCIACLGYVLAPLQISILSPSLSEFELNDAVLVARIAWITSGVMILSAFLRGMHNARKYFLFASLVSFVPSLCVIWTGLYISGTDEIVSIAWAMLIGFAFLTPLLLIHTFRFLDFSNSFSASFASSRRYLIGLPMTILAVLCFTAFQAIDSYWAPQIGEGNLAYLGYCQRLVVALGNLVIAGPIAVVMPKLSLAYTEGRVLDLLASTQRVIRMVLACSIPFAVFIGFLSEPIVRLFFERGAFTPGATREVATLLPWMMVGMVPMLCVVVIFKALFARQMITWAAGTGIFTTLLYFTLSGVLSRPLGVLGIALAYASTWWVIFFLSIYVLWRRDLKQFAHSDNGRFLGRLAALSFVVGIFCAFGNWWITQSNAYGITLAFQIGLVGVLGGSIYNGLAVWVMRLDEIRHLLSFIFQKLGLPAIQRAL